MIGVGVGMDMVAALSLWQGFVVFVGISNKSNILWSVPDTCNSSTTTSS